MTQKKKVEPSPDPEPGKSPFERMTDLTRRILAVPKREIPTRKK